MKRKWFFDLRFIGVVVVLATLFAASIVVAAGPDELQAADCSALETGMIYPQESVDIPFTCSIDQQVYFGVCDSTWDYDDLELQYLGVRLAYNDYPEPQVSHMGRAGAVAGLNIATLFNTDQSVPKGLADVNQADYVVAISPIFTEVAEAMNNQCDVPIESLSAPLDTSLFEGIFTGVNTGDDPLILKGTITELYPGIIFRASWPGSSGTLTVIKPSGAQVTEGDPGVNHTETETSDEIILINPEAGEYTIKFEPTEGFFNETVIMGAYAIGAPFSEGEHLGSVRGTVFDDANGNGDLDDGETGIAGVSVTIGSEGAWQATFVTGDDGTFAPVGLGKGYYSAEVTVPAGYVATSPTRYEAIAIGFTGRTALYVDFGLSATTTPAGLPASGFGPGNATGIVALAGLLIVAGFFILWQARTRVSGN
jgi:hypothetical protein